MYEFHIDKARYFNMQYKTSKFHILPFIKEFFPENKTLNVLEIGCAEAGVLKAFTELEHNCTGIELSIDRIELAKKFMSDEFEKGQIHFINKNIFDIDAEKDFTTKFDLIILKDVIEHIPNQEKFIIELKKFLTPQGKIFFGFPPFQMPFGGHQQVCKNKLLSVLPYYHLLPKSIYKFVLSIFRESKETIHALLEVKETGISIERFEKIVKFSGFNILSHKYFLINPIYEYKFNIKPREQNKMFSAIPYLRDYLSTCVYYLIESK